MLYQLSYFRNFPFLRRAPLPSFRGRRRPGGPCGRRWIRTTEVERQQIYSLPHLATLVSARYSNFKNLFPPTLSAPSRGPERRRRHRADGGIRTPDQLITNQLLWPTELHRQNQPFWIAKVGIKNLPAKLFPINFSLFYSSQRTSVYRLFYRGEIGCKDRKSFIFYNSFCKKYHPPHPRLLPFRPCTLRNRSSCGCKTLRHLFNI